MKKRVLWIVMILLGVSFMTGCTAKKNYAEDEPFVIVTSAPAGPDDYRNMFDHNVAVYNDGRLVLYTEQSDDLKIQEDVPTLEKQLTEEQVNELKSVIEKNQFQNLKEDVTTPSEDGTFRYIVVNWTDKSKKVGGLNPDDSRFMEISDATFDLVEKEEYRHWADAVSDYIWEKNPD